MTTYVWSIDDPGLGGSDQAESMRRTSRFFDSRGLRATWFAVPKPGGKPLTDDWKRALCEARDAGHDVQLHGLTHADCFEFGPPAWPATAISPELLTTFESRREELMARYTVENLRARIEEGQELFERELGVHPTVFRAPCNSISKAMFEALRQTGILYHSVAYISGTGYDHLPHRRSAALTPAWTEAIPHHPFRWYSGIVEAPMLNEYTWRGASAREPEFLALARADVERIARESPIAVILMHTHGIADNEAYAFRLIDAVAAQVQQQGGTFATLGELAESGALTRAATVDGPDTLTV